MIKEWDKGYMAFVMGYSFDPSTKSKAFLDGYNTAKLGKPRKTATQLFIETYDGDRSGYYH